jgi:small subunit ribosomal protein S6
VGLSGAHGGFAPERIEEKGTTMPLYEHVFLARQDVSPSQAEQLAKDYQTVLEGLGAKVTKSEYWGLKSLAFKIKKSRKAHYMMYNIDGPHAAIAEMQRQMSLAPDIIRHLTVKVDALEAEPSAMMRKSDRDDRGDRRGPRGPRDDFRGGGFRGGRDGEFRGGGRDRDGGGRGRRESFETPTEEDAS